MTGRTSLLLPALLLAVLVPCAARAQDAAAAPALVRVPAYTLVMLRMSERVNSDRNRTGDHFRFRVAEDVIVDGHIVIPAGSQGEGEVIHAAESGGRDHPGELVLAARYITVGDSPLGGRQIKLRTFVAGSTNLEHDALAVPVFDESTGGGRGDPANLGIGGMASARTAQDADLPPQEHVDDRPSPVASIAESAQIEFAKSTGTVVFFRERFHTADRRELMRIRENTNRVGELLVGGWFAVDVPVGIHEFTSRSPTFHDIRIAVDGGETYFIACGQPDSLSRTNCAPSNRAMFRYMRPELARETGKGNKTDESSIPQ